MAWKKASPALEAAFAKALPADPAVERRRMFGYPCAFAAGHMFTGLHEDRCVVRLGEADRTALLAEEGATPFVALGRTMREYVVVPPAMRTNPRRLRAWMRKGLAFVLALPPKAPRRAKAGIVPKRAAARGRRQTKR